MAGNDRCGAEGAFYHGLFYCIALIVLVKACTYWTNILNQSTVTPVAGGGGSAGCNGDMGALLLAQATLFLDEVALKHHEETLCTILICHSLVFLKMGLGPFSSANQLLQIQLKKNLTGKSHTRGTYKKVLNQGWLQ